MLLADGKEMGSFSIQANLPCVFKDGYSRCKSPTSPPVASTLRHIASGIMTDICKRVRDVTRLEVSYNIFAAHDVVLDGVLHSI